MAIRAGVAKPANARDLKSCAAKAACGFDSHLRHLRTLTYHPFNGCGPGGPLSTVEGLPVRCDLGRASLGRARPSYSLAFDTPFNTS